MLVIWEVEESAVLTLFTSIAPLSPPLHTPNPPFVLHELLVRVYFMRYMGPGGSWGNSAKRVWNSNYGTDSMCGGLVLI